MNHKLIPRDVELPGTNCIVSGHTFQQGTG